MLFKIILTLSNGIVKWYNQTTSQISRHLGSDAFIWLNDEMSFEADMFLPIFLRFDPNLN